MLYSVPIPAKQDTFCLVDMSSFSHQTEVSLRAVAIASEKRVILYIITAAHVDALM